MAQKAVVDAIVQRVKDNWAHAAVCPINDDMNDGSAAPADGGAYLSFDFPVSNAQQASVGAPGDNIWREEGVARVLLNVPAGSGIATVLQWGDEIAALFRGQYFDGVRTHAPSVASMDASNDAGSYFQIAVAIPYEFDLYG